MRCDDINLVVALIGHTELTLGCKLALQQLLTDRFYYWLFHVVFFEYVYRPYGPILSFTFWLFTFLLFYIFTLLPFEAGRIQHPPPIEPTAAPCGYGRMFAMV